MSGNGGPQFPHLTTEGHVHMVSVAGKPLTHRSARARGTLTTRPDVVAAVLNGSMPKGDVLAVARVAAILAAKRTAEWIPLAHPVPLSGSQVEIEASGNVITVVMTVETEAATGVEMEALTGVSAALLTLYDMLKKADRGLMLGPIWLEEKTGGQSGDFHRTEAGRGHPDRE